ncbi:MAG: Fis family transcriptional regulator [Okeania sp. SIO2H7]|nr:Fis family transcriptional regulator [Okeania sp. SIO2H7]
MTEKLDRDNSSDRGHQKHKKNTMKIELFELISAYLDGEVTPGERHQVEQLLASDRAARYIYNQLRQLHSGWQKMPAPPASEPVEQTVQKVFDRLDRRPRKVALFWGGTAFATLFAAILSGIVPGSRSLLPQLAKTPEPEPVQIALNEPIVEIINPKAAILSINAPLVQIPEPAPLPEN